MSLAFDQGDEEDGEPGTAARPAGTQDLFAADDSDLDEVSHRVQLLVGRQARKLTPSTSQGHLLGLRWAIQEAANQLGSMAAPTQRSPCVQIHLCRHAQFVAG